MIAEKLIGIYPLADPTRDFIVQDDGKGPYIAYWNTDKLGPQPDTESLPDAPPPDVLRLWDKITIKISLNHENRIRALEGKPAITVAQFKTAVKTLL